MNRSTYAILFFTLGAIFLWHAYQAHTTGKIQMPKSSRYYDKESSRFLYWFTFWLYVILFALCMVLGLWLVAGR